MPPYVVRQIAPIAHFPRIPHIPHSVGESSMLTIRSLTTFVVAAMLGAASAVACAQAQPASKPYEPSVGQEGKDVVWVPTPQTLVDRMLDMAKATPQDYVMDLGSGDGRTVITAAKRGIRAT